MKSWQAIVIAASVVGASLTPAAAQQTSPGSSPSSSAPSQSSSPNQPGVQIEATSLIGSTVRSADGKDIGKVYQLLIDSQSGRVSSVVVSIGGTLGIGEKRVTVPWDAVKVGRDDRRVVVTTDQRILDPAPPKAEDRSRDQNTPAASPSTSTPQK
ncbi:MAG TPA: PRC-barrel domain-containing protein [Methylomirabilota bacterium]